MFFLFSNYQNGNDIDLLSAKSNAHFFNAWTWSIPHNEWKSPRFSNFEGDLAMACTDNKPTKKTEKACLLEADPVSCARGELVPINNASSTFCIRERRPLEKKNSFTSLCHKDIIMCLLIVAEMHEDSWTDAE